jgi:predicted metal-dependent HD superfamily phosphohydrolase
MTDTDAEGRRFDALWRRCVASPPCPGAPVVRAELNRLLGAPGRRFHNLDHIRECLRVMDEVAPLLADCDAVELALWFHDAVYEPGDATNERRSAELFVAMSAGAAPAFRRRVCGLILATRHATEPRTADRRFIEDIDLVGFGAPWERFMMQGDWLRAEFADQPDALYYAGQVRFLTHLRRRPRFFATDYFRDRYEATAQANLARLLELRAAQGYEAPDFG